MNVLLLVAVAVVIVLVLAALATVIVLLGAFARRVATNVVPRRTTGARAGGG